MRRVLLVSLAIALPVSGFAVLATADPEAVYRPPTDLAWTNVGIAARDEMPGADGWFAFPVYVDRPAYVRFTIDTFAGGERLGESWAGILSTERTDAMPGFGTGNTESYPLLKLDGAGRSHECCAEMDVTWFWGGGGAETVIALAPGDTAWFGIAGAAWDTWDDAWLSISGQATITLGVPKTGTSVSFVDLAEEAQRAGTRVRLGGSDIVSLPGEASVSFSPEHAGLFFLSATAYAEGATAKLDVTMPGLDPRSLTLTSDDAAWGAAHRAGDYSVKLHDIQGPKPGTNGIFGYEWLDARVFFADIDVPGDVAFIYP